MIDLTQFCSNRKFVNYDISTLFIINGYVYATDGRILIRVKTSCTPDSVYSKKWRFPKSVPGFKEWDYQGKEIAWPALNKSSHKYNEFNDAVQFVGVWLDSYYINLVNALPNPKGIESSKYKKNGPIKFIFDGGEGLLMGKSL